MQTGRISTVFGLLLGFFCNLRVFLQIHSTVGDGEPGAPLHPSNFSRMSSRWGKTYGSHLDGRLRNSQQTSAMRSVVSTFPKKKKTTIKKKKIWDALAETGAQSVMAGPKIQRPENSTGSMFAAPAQSEHFYRRVFSASARRK